MQQNGVEQDPENLQGSFSRTEEENDYTKMGTEPAVVDECDEDSTQRVIHSFPEKLSSSPSLSQLELHKEDVLSRLQEERLANLRTSQALISGLVVKGLAVLGILIILSIFGSFVLHIHLSNRENDPRSIHAAASSAIALGQHLSNVWEKAFITLATRNCNESLSIHFETIRDLKRTHAALLSRFGTLANYDLSINSAEFYREALSLFQAAYHLQASLPLVSHETLMSELESPCLDERIAEGQFLNKMLELTTGSESIAHEFEGLAEVILHDSVTYQNGNLATEKRLFATKLIGFALCVLSVTILLWMGFGLLRPAFSEMSRYLRDSAYSELKQVETQLAIEINQQRRILGHLDISKAVLSSLDMKSTIISILSKAREILRAQYVAIYIPNALTKTRSGVEAYTRYWTEDGERLNCKPAIHCDNSIVAHVCKVGNMVNSSLKSLQEAQQISAEEVDEIARFSSEGSNVMVYAAPLSGGNNQNGVLIATHSAMHKNDEFSLQGMSSFRLLVTQAQMAIRNSQLHLEMMRHTPFHELMRGNESILRSYSIVRNQSRSVSVEECTYLQPREPKSAISLSSNDTLTPCTSNGKILRYCMSALVEDKGKIGKQRIVWVVEDLTERARTRRMLSRYLSPALAERVMKDGADTLGGVQQMISVLFCDIRGFTTLCENRSPSEILEMLNRFFGRMVKRVFQNNGILDKYIGDAMMCCFGVPYVSKRDAANACLTALQMCEDVMILNRERKSDLEQPIAVGIGINSGECISGNIGCQKRMEYTVIGDAVNLASRMEGATKKYQVPIIITASTYEAVKDEFVCRELDNIRVIGRTIPVTIYELLQRADQPMSHSTRCLLKEFDQALSCYRSRCWDKAILRFTRCLQLRPNDGPSHVYLERCRELLQESHNQKMGLVSMRSVHADIDVEFCNRVMSAPHLAADHQQRRLREQVQEKEESEDQNHSEDNVFEDDDDGEQQRQPQQGQQQQQHAHETPQPDQQQQQLLRQLHQLREVGEEDDEEGTPKKRGPGRVQESGECVLQGDDSTTTHTGGKKEQLVRSDGDETGTISLVGDDNWKDCRDSAQFSPRNSDNTKKSSLGDDGVWQWDCK